MANVVVFLLYISVLIIIGNSTDVCTSSNNGEWITAFYEPGSVHVVNYEENKRLVNTSAASATKYRIHFNEFFEVKPYPFNFNESLSDIPDVYTPSPTTALSNYAYFIIFEVDQNIFNDFNGVWDITVHDHNIPWITSFISVGGSAKFWCVIILLSSTNVHQYYIEYSKKCAGSASTAAVTTSCWAILPSTDTIHEGTLAGCSVDEYTGNGIYYGGTTTQAGGDFSGISITGLPKLNKPSTGMWLYTCTWITI